MQRNRELIIFIITILLLVIFFNYYRNNYQENILKNGKQTVAKIVELNGQSRRKAFHFIFYSNNICTRRSGFRENFPNVKVGKFYKVFYLPENTEECFIDLENEITDATLILEAGFSREDIVIVK